MSKNKFDFDLIVIGSGAGGSAAATIAAREGKRFAIVEADTFGGTSPNWGDVPIKSLLHAAQLFDDQADMVIVKVNTLLHRLLDGMPVSLFKALLGAGSHFKKTTILGVKTLQNSLSNQ